MLVLMLEVSRMLIICQNLIELSIQTRLNLLKRQDKTCQTNIHMPLFILKETYYTFSEKGKLEYIYVLYNVFAQNHSHINIYY